MMRIWLRSGMLASARICQPILVMGLMAAIFEMVLFKGSSKACVVDSTVVAALEPSCLDSQLNTSFIAAGLLSNATYSLTRSDLVLGLSSNSRNVHGG